MNYGHPLTFGTALTPKNGPPDAPVALARRSEELGYDLVTFQDHPYQPRFHDTWTLLSWTAGRTERVHLAPNVLNLPLRQPAVLARAAAGLDLLSGGRVELALGAGAFWDEIEAMGGRRLSPDQAVDALAEAIDVVRGVLDAGDGTPMRHRGEHYRVEGAERGPLPLHHIPIWVGGLKPRMLRLIGRKADGWLPSLGTGRLDRVGLAHGNKIIDEAAAEAGRDPAAVRRLVNITGAFSERSEGFLRGPVGQWVEELLPLVVDDGVSAFILASDDPSTLERFAREVVPALREAVDAELPAPLPTGTMRSPEVRAERRDGIDYDGVPTSLADTAVEPGDIEYARVRSNYLRGGSPGIVLRPRTTAEVVDALAFARRHPHLPLGIRSGGHGVSGRSTNDGGIVIDLRRMNTVEVLDEATRRVRVGPGARWKDVAAALRSRGWALTSGDHGGVGVGGLATAAGIGLLGRRQGLTIDRLRAAEVVLADGSVVRADETENPDLFWAIRGAGGNFGIVTSFEFEADEVGDVGYAQLVLDASDPEVLLRRFGEVATAAPRDTTAFLTMGPTRPGRPGAAQVMAIVASGDPDVVLQRLQPFAAIAPLIDHQVVVAPYSAVMDLAPDDDHHGLGEPVSRSAFIREITPEFAGDAARLLASGAVYYFAVRTVGGAIADVDPDATAYPHRDAGFAIAAMGIDPGIMDQLWDPLREEHFDGLYLSFETDPRPERLVDAFGPHLERLRELKARYDPDNVFRDNFTLTPATAEAHTKEPT